MGLLSLRRSGDSLRTEESMSAMAKHGAALLWAAR